MKRAWNFLWILLTAAVTAAGFFLPRLALSRQGTPNFAMNYQTVEISSRTSTDYAWRLKTLTRQQMLYWETDTLAESGIQETDITDRYSAEEQGNMIAQLLKEAQKLVEGKVIPAAVLQMMETGSCRVEIQYLFDAETLRGFPYGRFSFVLESGGKQQDSYQVVHVCADLSGGKIYELRGYGFGGQEITEDYPVDMGSWQERLRSFADYLGLGETTVDNRKNPGGETPYEPYGTDARLGALSPDGDGWFELRAVQDSGMEVFSMLLYRTGGK